MPETRSPDAASPRPTPVRAARPHAGSGRPGLVFFYSRLSGRCRRVEGYLAQVLQRRHNHGTFDIVRVDADARPELLERFGIEHVPTFLVVADKRICARLEDPRGCKEIEEFLQPWLRRPDGRERLAS